jgi:hypothetical protein
VKRTIFETLRLCDQSDACSKPELLKVLHRKFPNNSLKSLEHEVDSFPHWLPKHYPFKIRQIDKCYWLEPLLLPIKKGKAK